MHRSAGFALAALLLTIGTSATAVAGTSPRAAEPARAAALTRLHATSAHAFVDSTGARHLLIGPNLQPVWDADDTDTWDQATYDSIKAKGFTAVRMVLFWDLFQPTEAEWNETAFATLAAAVERAKAAGLYVVLDCVHMSGDSDGQEHVPDWARVDPDDTTEGLDAVVENGLGFLQTIANRYKDELTIAAYDPVNEPFRTSTRSARLMSDYTRIVNAIRAKDGVTSIMLEPSYGDAKVPASSFSSLTPTSRTNLIWSIHDYYNGDSKSGYTAYYNDGTGLGMDPNPPTGPPATTRRTRPRSPRTCRCRSTRPRNRACRSGSGSSASATVPPVTTSTSRTRSRSTSPRASTTPGGSTTPTAETARSAWSTRTTPGAPGSA